MKNNLPILQQYTLIILEQIEYALDTKDCFQDNKFSITFEDIDFAEIKKPENIYSVADFLKTKDINFVITFDFVNDHPDRYESDKELGYIEDKDLASIKLKIKALINEFRSKNIEINIVYHMSIGQFVFNEKDIIVVEGKQKDVSDYLTKAGKNIKTSWDEMYEKMQDIVESKSKNLNKEEIKLAKKSINGAVKEINKKTEKYLEEDKQLIDFKNNEYWLQYKVKIDG